MAIILLNDELKMSNAQLLTSALIEKIIEFLLFHKNSTYIIDERAIHIRKTFVYYCERYLCESLQVSAKTALKER